MVCQQPEVRHQANGLPFAVKTPIARVETIAMTRATDNEIRFRRGVEKYIGGTAVGRFVSGEYLLEIELIVQLLPFRFVFL
jgi:hypothetical protein